MKISIKRVLKNTVFVFLFVLAMAVAYQWELVDYGLRQGYGQLKIIWNAKPVEEYMEDPNFPDSLKIKLALIEEVRHYAINELGLKPTKNYTTLYDQQGKELMWAEPFAMEFKEWSFPIVGSVSYKGFFDEDRAEKLRESLVAEGYDVIVRNPGGWSTLGWFTDPILSNMLERSEGDLVNLIIHEMVHATIFVKDSVEYNENLASFIGDRGTEEFLIQKYGSTSTQYVSYVDEDVDYQKFIEHMLRGGDALDSLYRQFVPEDPLEKKQGLKTALIETIIQQLDTLTFLGEKRPTTRFKKELPNNAYFMNIRQYQSKQDDFWTLYEAHQRDLKRVVSILKSKYGK
jgi:predicted aminopeptidase